MTVRWFRHGEEIERERAKERQSEVGGSEPGSANLREADKGKTSGKVGEKVGVSGRTYEKGKTVKEKPKTATKHPMEAGNLMDHGESGTLCGNQHRADIRGSVGEANPRGPRTDTLNR